MARFSIRQVSVEYGSDADDQAEQGGFETWDDEDDCGCWDSRDELHRQILGALNRSRILPYPRNVRAEREFKQLCSLYRQRYGHLNISSSLPLRLVRAA